MASPRGASPTASAPSAEALKKEMKGEVDKVVDVDKLGAKAQEKLKELGDKAKDIDVEKLERNVAGEAQGTRRQGQGRRRQQARRGGAQEARRTQFVRQAVARPKRRKAAGRIRSGVEALEKTHAGGARQSQGPRRAATLALIQHGTTPNLIDQTNIREPRHVNVHDRRSAARR